MQKNKNDLRFELVQMSSSELSQLIRAETGKETPDDDLVLTALEILEERKADRSVELGPESREAWEDYLEKFRARQKKPLLTLGNLAKAASIVLILGVLLVSGLTQEAHAGSLWKIIAQAGESIFQYVNIGQKETEPEEYVFQSDNPGLQQVYEAVVTELGVTEPVVVQWLEEGYELTTLDIIETPAKKGVHAVFCNSTSEIVLVFDQMQKDLSQRYYKTETRVDVYEYNGVIHNFVQNNELWLVSWTKQNLKCSISINCQEDVLKQIIKSIY